MAFLRPLSPKVKFLLDFGPLAVFFIGYQLAGLNAATVGLVVATLIAIAITYAVERKVALMPVITAVVVSIFGGLTLLLSDELFIKIKPTIVNLLFALILLGGCAFGKSFLKTLLGTTIALTDKGWLQLSARWGVFFLFLAGLNEWVWRNYSTDFWVDFKVFGMFTCTILFTLAQIPLMQREMLVEEEGE